jgi:hypothetical protein
VPALHDPAVKLVRTSVVRLFTGHTTTPPLSVRTYNIRPPGGNPGGGPTFTDTVAGKLTVRESNTHEAEPGSTL